MLYTEVNGLASLSATFLFLTTTTVVLRFLARRSQGSRTSFDDYAAVAAWVCARLLWLWQSPKTGKSLTVIWQVGFVGMVALSFFGELTQFPSRAHRIRAPS